jgi:hypothetical protein
MKGPPVGRLFFARNSLCCRLSLAAQEWGNPNGLEIVFIHGSHLAFFD